IFPVLTEEGSSFDLSLFTLLTDILTLEISPAISLEPYNNVYLTQGWLLVRSRIWIAFILIIFIFLVIPLIISVAYGNVPFFDRSPLYSSDVLVTNNQKLFESTNMPIFIKTYTWQEIQGYIVRKEVTFVRVFRNIVVLFLTAVIAIVLDRMFGHLLPINIRRR